MLAGVSPSCVAVSRDVDYWEVFTHAASLVFTLNRSLEFRLLCE